MEDKTVLGDRILKIKPILLAMVFLSFLFCGPANADGPWRGVVIDAVTKEPLEGAVVVAVWTKHFLAPTGRASSYVTAKETLTDKKGRYEIPAYTLISLPFIRAIDEPEFTIFKPGYGYTGGLNNPFSHLSIYAIGPSEIGYEELRWMTTADGHAMEYAVSKRKKYTEGLIYSGDGCKERMAAVKETTPFTIDFFMFRWNMQERRLTSLMSHLIVPKRASPFRMAGV